MSTALLVTLTSGQASSADEGTSESGYGGRATGKATLVTLPSDPAYQVPAPLTKALSPETLDDPSTWQENIVCDPVDRPGVEAFGNLIGKHYNRPGYTTSRPCRDQKSEHYDGRAIDWQLNAYDPADRRIGDAAVTWLTDNDGEMARRFGIQSIIWNKRVWHSYDRAGWQGYSGQSPHTDHVHFSFSWDGANMRTSWWTGVAVERPDLGPCRAVAGEYAAVPEGPRYEPCPTSLLPTPDAGYAVVRPGEDGAGVSVVQPLLNVPQTGVLDPATRDALVEWQTQKGIPETGVLDQMTYAVVLGRPVPRVPASARAVAAPAYLRTVFTPYKRTMLAEGDRGAAVRVLQEVLGVDVDGSFGPITAAALLKFTSTHPLLRPSSTTTPLTWHLLEQRLYPSLAYRDVVLGIGDRGETVRVLQRYLDVEDDGVFGPITQRAVMDAQIEAGLAPTGSVTGETWGAIGAAGATSTGLGSKDAEGVVIDSGAPGQHRHTDY